MSFQTSNISISSFNTIPSNSSILLQKVPNSKKREYQRDSIDSQETLVGLSDTVLEKKGDFNKVKAMEEKVSKDLDAICYTFMLPLLFENPFLKLILTSNFLSS